MAEIFEHNLDRAAFAEHYELLSELGAGTFGKVYLARQHSLRRSVAVKLFAARVGGWAGEEAARIVREARIMAGLSHPRVLKIFDAGVLEGAPFLVVEYLDGSDLARHLAKQGALGVTESLRLGLAIAEGLEYLHQQRIVHRDLKPANVLLGRDDAVKVSDFGIARPVESTAALTAEGMMLGTPFYMPPEMIRTSSAGTAGDIYSLGLILHECLHGELPFDTAGSVGEVFRRRLAEPLREPSAQLPATLGTLLRQCLETDPDRRPAAAAVAAGLRKASLAALSLGVTAPAATRPATQESSRTSWDSGTMVAGQSAVSKAQKTARISRPATPARSRWPRILFGVLVALAAGAIVLQPKHPAPPSPPPPPPTAAVPHAAPPPAPANVEAERIAAIVDLAAHLRSVGLDYVVRHGGISPALLRARIEQPEMASRLTRAAGALAVLAPGRLPVSETTRSLMPLHWLRLADTRLKTAGEKSPAALAALAGAAFPLLLEAPRDAAVIRSTAAGVPCTLAEEPRGELGPALEDRERLPVLKLSVPRLSGRTNSTVWWVLDVDGLSHEYVLDVFLQTRAGTLVFPFVALQAAPVYNGMISMGFDPRLLDGWTGTVRAGCSPLRGPVRKPPVVRRLELRESEAR
ncbi:MAG: serine/threonine protein kinase [Candidatus Wallbacteria bacterium]|nr:serine/threonine protein kinase [Candidatus Wallbacteria bacterium]